MPNNTLLDISALTPTRQRLLTDVFHGHSLDMENGKFTKDSYDGLMQIGLTAIEIKALETANGSVGKRSFDVVAAYGSSNNPYKKENWDPVAQRQIHDSDPKLARQLMKEAGLL